MVKQVERRFDGSPESVREARAFVAGVVGAWELPDLEELAVLLTSEVATNAVRHARTPFQVSVERRPLELLVKVRDGSTALPRPLDVPLDSEGGRGLPLVRVLTSRWGSATRDDGKLVWFALEAPQRREG
ncbi:MAG: ATP-binding protein [Acidimicrobiales bacterium]